MAFANLHPQYKIQLPEGVDLGAGTQDDLLPVLRRRIFNKDVSSTVEHRGRFLRVQVKSTMFIDRGGYSCTVRGSDGPYEGDPFDYLAAYTFQEDMWYIIPAELVVGQGSIALYPELERAKYGPYKEAWHLLQRAKSHPRGKRRRKDGAPTESHIVDCIHACVEEDSDDLLWMSWLWRAVRCVRRDGKSHP